jgi:hypothetical protein
MGSLAEPKRIRYCASCGGSDVGAKIESLGDTILLCAECISAGRAGAGWGYWFPTKDVSPIALPQGFDELFAAARVLLEEDAEENQIIPTLALAYHLSHGVPRLVAERERLVRCWRNEQLWTEEADAFARRYGGLRPIKVAGQTLILERRPVLVTIEYGVGHDNPLGVRISAHPFRTRLATSKEVASLYEKVLANAGITCDERRTGRLNFNFHNSRLEISVEPGATVEYFVAPQDGWRRDKASFPHPHLVGDFYKVLVTTVSTGGFAADLPTRKSNKPPKADNLVPACVAFLLKDYGVRPDKKVNELLDKYVLDDAWKSGKHAFGRDLFRDAIRGTSLYEQVWGNARKQHIVRDPLTDAAWTLFWEGYE